MTRTSGNNAGNKKQKRVRKLQNIEGLTLLPGTAAAVNDRAIVTGHKDEDDNIDIIDPIEQIYDGSNDDHAISRRAAERGDGQLLSALERTLRRCRVEPTPDPQFKKLRQQSPRPTNAYRGLKSMRDGFNRVERATFRQARQNKRRKLRTMSMALVYHIGPLELISGAALLSRRASMSVDRHSTEGLACQGLRPDRSAVAGGSGVVDKTVTDIRTQLGLNDSRREVQQRSTQPIADQSMALTTQETSYERITYYPLPGSTDAYTRVVHGFEELDPIITISSSQDSSDDSEDLFEEERDKRAVTLEGSQSPKSTRQLPVLDRNASSIQAYQTSSAETWVIVEQDPIDSGESRPTSQQKPSCTQPRPRTAFQRSVRRPTIALAPRPSTMTSGFSPATRRCGNDLHPLMALIPPFMQPAQVDKIA